MKGGGSPSTTTNQTQIPAWLSEAGQQTYMQAVNTSQGLQQPYTGNLVAGLTPEQLASFQGVNQLYQQGLAPSTIQSAIAPVQTAQAAIPGQVGMANLAAGTAGGYVPQVGTAADTAAAQAAAAAQGGGGMIAGQLPALGQAQALTANLPGAAQNLLSPYLALQEQTALPAMLRSQAQALNAAQAQAAGANAFGGSRAGVNEALTNQLSQEAIGSQMASIANQGWDTAVSQALSQGQQLGSLAQVGGQLGAQYGNLGLGAAGATTAAGNLLANAGNLALGTGQLYNQGVSGLAAGANLSGLVGSLAGQGQAAQLANLQALSSAGQQQQNQQQAVLDMLAQQYAAQGNYPLQQLAVQEQALGAVPYGTTTTSSQSATGGSNVLGALGSALSIGSKIASFF